MQGDLITKTLKFEDLIRRLDKETYEKMATGLKESLKKFIEEEGSTKGEKV